MEDSLSDTESERVLQAIIDWSCYAKLFAYDYDAGVFSAKNPGEDAAKNFLL